jgi:hypothetical protein
MTDLNSGIKPDGDKGGENMISELELPEKGMVPVDPYD